MPATARPRSRSNRNFRADNCCGFPVRSNRAAAFEIQTKLEAARMKTASPIERTLCAKVMPLDSDAELIDIAVERAPPVFHLTPSLLLGCATGIHLA